MLADYGGNNHYYAEPSAKVVNRGDYHSNFDINVSNAQGVGSGRRGDGSDGHSYAGGLGLIADIHGHNTYEAGNFSEGCGYWFGTGLMYNKEGDNTYKSVYFSQASTAHYAIGAIVDEGGNNNHELWATSGAGLSFGWDFGISMLIAKGGNNTYKAYRISGASSDIRSNAFFFNLGGGNHFIFGESDCLGAVDFQNYDKPHPLSPFYEYCNSIGLFIVAGGNNTYTNWIKKTVGEGKDAKEVDTFEPSTKWADNSRWEFIKKDDPHYGYNNFGIGWDVRHNPG